MIERKCLIMEACSFFTCRLYTVQASAPDSRVDSTIARYVLPLLRIGTWWLFLGLWRSRPRDAQTLAILLCISSSIYPSLDIVVSRRVNSRTKFSLFRSTVISSSRVLVELGWYSTSVFLMLIFRPNLLTHRRKHPLFSASLQQSVQPVHSHLRIAALQVVLVFALKCATLNWSALCLDCM